MPESILTLSEIQEARKRIRDIAIETPLIKSHVLSQELGINLYFKCEFIQEVGSFKVRGASNKVLSMFEKGYEYNTFVTASSGNHGIAVSYIAKKMGKKAFVFAPKVATSHKLALIKLFGAEVIFKGDYSDQAAQYAKEYAEKNNALFIHAFDDRDVIAGQGTIGLELIEQLDEIDYLLIPVGGGGLIAGISFVIKSMNKNAKIIGIQPAGNPSLHDALKMGKVVTTLGTNTIAEGLAVRKVGDLVFDIVRDKVDFVALESDENILKATRLIFEKERILLEPSGAAAFSYLLDHKVEKGSNVVVILTGRNISQDRLEKIFYSG
ncbi:MAG TPA: threonine/serine dehydratase [Geobacterales bacterium]|nr:threonine/serine dehydratase [Geobacterales bacterium]